MNPKQVDLHEESMARRKKAPNAPKKRTKREIALASLEKAMTVKRGEIPAKPKGGTRREKSQQRLEKIIERVEKRLSDGDALDKADSLKLATTLKVCHNQLRAIREETEGGPVIRTHAEAQESIEKELATLCAVLKRLPPGAQRYFREVLDKHLPKVS
jgi:hypothetical protein